MIFRAGARHFVIILLAGCLGNPLGPSSTQDTTFHPGYKADTPIIVAVLPNFGSSAGGTSLVIEGRNFSDRASVSIGGLNCSNVQFISTTKVTCATVAHAVGAADVTLTNPDGGASTLSAGFSYFAAVNPVAGFASVSAGGVATGPGVRLRFTAGPVGDPVRAVGTAAALRSGVQSVLASP